MLHRRAAVATGHRGGAVQAAPPLYRGQIMSAYLNFHRSVQNMILSGFRSVEYSRVREAAIFAAKSRMSWVRGFSQSESAVDMSLALLVVLLFRSG